MTTTFINGYNVTGNHATSGREYRVCDASGRALHTAAGIEPAMAVAQGMRPGDVVPVTPEPVVEMPPEIEAVVAPVEQPEKKPTTRRTTQSRGGK